MSNLDLAKIPKLPIVKVGTFTADGQPYQWEFDGSGPNSVGLYIKGSTMLYGGYYVTELEAIAEQHKKIQEAELLLKKVFQGCHLELMLYPAGGILDVTSCAECGAVEEQTQTVTWRVKKNESLATAVQRMKFLLGIPEYTK